MGNTAIVTVIAGRDCEKGLRMWGKKKTLRIICGKNKKNFGQAL